MNKPEVRLCVKRPDGEGFILTRQVLTGALAESAMEQSDGISKVGDFCVIHRVNDLAEAEPVYAHVVGGREI